jgi:hypothetical protein
MSIPALAPAGPALGMAACRRRGRWDALTFAARRSVHVSGSHMSRTRAGAGRPGSATGSGPCTSAVTSRPARTPTTSPSPRSPPCTGAPHRQGGDTAGEHCRADAPPSWPTCAVRDQSNRVRPTGSGPAPQRHRLRSAVVISVVAVFSMDRSRPVYSRSKLSKLVSSHSRSAAWSAVTSARSASWSARR